MRKSLSLLLLVLVGCGSHRIEDPVASRSVPGTVAEPVPSPVSVSPASVSPTSVSPVSVPAPEGLIVAPPDTPSKPNEPVQRAQRRGQREDEYSYDTYMPPKCSTHWGFRSLRSSFGM